MNLAAYDNVESIINKKRSWIDVHHKCLYTKEIKYRKYICFGKKFDPEENKTVFYIITLNDEPKDRPSFKAIVTNNGYIKIDIRSIWYDTGLDNIKAKYINVLLRSITDSDDGNIYEFCPIC